VVLYRSDRSRVARQWAPDGRRTVIVKQLTGPGAARRLRHEVAILERLAGTVGVPQLAPPPHPPGAILLTDLGGQSLAEMVVAGPVEPVLATGLATELARTLARVHAGGVVHRDVSPTNILVAGQPPVPLLIDFDLATTHAEERPGFSHQTEIVGTLAYLAPEQTGRTGWAVDQRADLYGLGAVLYELVTGAPPFRTSDPLRLIHEHLALLPAAPAEVNPAVPPMLSAIIMRLLEKEPDRRYQSADGLGHDLARLRDGLASGDVEPFELARRDFPVRLTAPSRPVGRAAEIEVLVGAFTGTGTGTERVRGVLVTGPPGVGKTVVVDELRSVVTAAGGWFVTGKFDQHRRDLAGDGLGQAFVALVQLLLAEPEAELAPQRERVRRALGPNAGLVAAVLDGIRVLLDVPPEPPVGDPQELQGRLVQASLDLVRAIAQPTRPIVLALDDLQWAASTPLGFVDGVLTGDPIDGLLLIGAHREVDATHPLAALRDRWQQLGVRLPTLRLANLPPTDVSTLLAEMLRLPRSRTGELADAVAARTGGNPYDTVELVNALRRDGALVVGADGWSWDTAAVRRHAGRGDVLELLAARIAALPAEAGRLLSAMACLGGQVDVELLTAATGLPADTVDQLLAPALEDGLLVLGTGGAHRAGQVVRFRHDRVQQAAYEGLAPPDRRALHLSLARALAGTPELVGMAAEQYLPAVELVREPAERRQVAALLRAAAAGIQLINAGMAERFLAAGLGLLDADGPDGGPDAELLVALQTDRHAALVNLGRLEEADEPYGRVAARGSDPVQLVPATCVQIVSLCKRARYTDAISLGLDLLARLGVVGPGPDLLGEVTERVTELCGWFASVDRVGELTRPGATDPRVLAVAAILSTIGAPAFFSDPLTAFWLCHENHRQWVAHGVSAPMLVSTAFCALAVSAFREDYRTAYELARLANQVGDAHGYQLRIGPARFVALLYGHWLEPIAEDGRKALAVRTELLHAGDLAWAGNTYHVSVGALLGGAQSLAEYAEEVETALAFAARTGDEHSAPIYLGFRQLVRALQGETTGPGSMTDADFDTDAHLAALTDNPMATGFLQVNLALLAAIFDQGDELRRWSAAAMPQLPNIDAHYHVALARLLRVLALAGQLRLRPPGDPPAADAVAELDASRDWLARRAADAPGNFRPMLLLAEAERAWAVAAGSADHPAATGLGLAALAFDAAQEVATGLGASWQGALILERAGLFQVEHGLGHGGHDLLAAARATYREWGATGKVDDLDRWFPLLRGRRSPSAGVGPGTMPDVRRTTSISAGTIDLLAVLEASQALSSETGLGPLLARVSTVLSAMTGATAVRVLLWQDERQEWLLPPGPDAASDALCPLPDGPAADRLLPLSVLRYVERTREPLVVHDATGDDRFARDPYLAGLPTCSLLAVPILSRGLLRAVLLLENQLGRGAFSAERLDAARLIAGQIAVSLDNALLYASLEQKVTQRTEELNVANEQLAQLSVTDPLTGLANRRRMTEVLQSEWQLLGSSGRPLAIIMIDVDHFKRYNDHYGHLAGDECLRRVATAIATAARATDLTARYGGEEFVVVLPRADTDAAARAGERIRAAIAGLAEPHALAEAGFVTVSVGVAAAVPTLDGLAENLVKAADTQLYQAKRNGRNQVAVGPD
jgi:diguanylate cyclase (GGDEF)-like protein